MCQHCINSDTNTISRRAVLKESASLQKLKNKVVSQVDTVTIRLSGGEGGGLFKTRHSREGAYSNVRKIRCKSTQETS